MNDLAGPRSEELLRGRMVGMGERLRSYLLKRDGGAGMGEGPRTGMGEGLRAGSGEVLRSVGSADRRIEADISKEHVLKSGIYCKGEGRQKLEAGSSPESSR